MKKPFVWVVQTAARAVVFTVALLFLWTVVPLAFGWSSSAVMSDSMRPALSAGSVIVTMPADEGNIAPGRILLTDRVGHPGELLSHRMVERSDDGSIVLRGDANPSVDSATVTDDQVHGVARLVVPWMGLTALWVQDHRYLLLAGTALGLLVSLLLAVWNPRSENESQNSEDSDDDSGDVAPADLNDLLVRSSS